MGRFEGAVGPLLAAGCLLLAGYLWLEQRDAARLETANRLGAAGQLAGAARVAHGLTRPPVRGPAAITEGYAQLGLRRPGPAAAAFRRAVAAQPQDWLARRGLAQALLAAGDRSGARRAMARALALNPRLVLPAGFRRAPGTAPTPG